MSGDVDVRLDFREEVEDLVLFFAAIHAGLHAESVHVEDFAIDLDSAAWEVGEHDALAALEQLLRDPRIEQLDVENVLRGCQHVLAKFRILLQLSKLFHASYVCPFST